MKSLISVCILLAVVTPVLVPELEQIITDSAEQTLEAFGVKVNIALLDNEGIYEIHIDWIEGTPWDEDTYVRKCVGASSVIIGLLDKPCDWVYIKAMSSGEHEKECTAKEYRIKSSDVQKAVSFVSKEDARDYITKSLEVKECNDKTFHRMSGAVEIAETQLGFGFSCKNVSFKELVPGSTKAIGEITNNSEKNYSTVTFTLSVYDESGMLVNTSPILLSNIATGQTKSFDTIIDSDYRTISKFKIDYDNGI